MTASFLRFLRTASGAISARYPDSSISGNLVVTDASEENESSLAFLHSNGQEVRAGLEIPSEWLWMDPGGQEKVLQDVLSARPLSTEEERPGTIPGPTRSGESRLVQFVNCASLFEKREALFSSIPPAVFYMAPALKKRGFQVAVDTLMMEAFVEPRLAPREIQTFNHRKLDQIIEKKPFCIALTAMDYYLEELRHLLREIRARDEEVLIAVGGPMVTLYPEKAPVYLTEGNIFISGEADLVFSDVLSCLVDLNAVKNMSEKEFSGLNRQKGLFLRSGDTVYVSGLDQKNWMQEIDEIFQEGIDLSYIEKEHCSRGIYLHTSRGCPFQCAFCAKVHGSRVRSLTSETIFRLLSAYEERLEEIREASGLTESERQKALQLTFSDDNFLLDRERARTFFQDISKHPFSIKTVPADIPSFLSEEAENKRVFDTALFDALKASGERIGSFEIGTDDFSQRELLRLAKGHPRSYTLEEIREVMSRLEELKISNRHFVILSNPDTRWPDLFGKLISIEELSWSFPHFFPDPNPFVLAPVGTPVFEEILRAGKADTLTRKVFEISGFPEFTHWIFNMAPPEEEVFSAGDLSCVKFFRRLCDLLKGSRRFSIFNEAYIHFFEVCRGDHPGKGDLQEKEEIFSQVSRAVHLRRELLLSITKNRFFWPGEVSKGIRKLNTFLEIFLGMFLVRETLTELFPEEIFSEKIEKISEQLDTFFAQIDNWLETERDVHPLFLKQLQKAFISGREWISCSGTEKRGPDKRMIARGFEKTVAEKLRNKDLIQEANEWTNLCAPGGSLLRLEVTVDRADARFIHDSEKIDRFLELIRLADPEGENPVEDVQFLQAELVLYKTIKDDYLELPETRIFLYNTLANVPPDFKDRFLEEFDISCFFDKEEFIASVLSKFLTLREIPHNPEVYATDLFEGLEPVFQTLIPQALADFSKWFFQK